MENRDISFDVNAKIETFLDYNELDLYRRKEKSSKNGRNFCSLQIKVHKIVSYFFHRSYSSRVASTTNVICICLNHTYRYMNQVVLFYLSHNRVREVPDRFNNDGSRTVRSGHGGKKERGRDGATS